MKLRFDPQEIVKWEQQYSKDLSPGEKELMELRRLPLAKEGLSLLHLKKLVRWKSPRSVHWIQDDQEAYIREMTRFALSADNERSRIEALTLLDGVGWPTASVILHFYHAERYPILDFRALWSVGADLEHKYDFGFWAEYVDFCREEAKTAGVDMRTLDRALWQFSKTSSVVLLRLSLTEQQHSEIHERLTASGHLIEPESLQQVLDALTADGLVVMKEDEQGAQFYRLAEGKAVEAALDTARATEGKPQ